MRAGITTPLDGGCSGPGTAGRAAHSHPRNVLDPASLPWHMPRQAICGGVHAVVGRGERPATAATGRPHTAYLVPNSRSPAVLGSRDGHSALCVCVLRGGERERGRPRGQRGTTSKTTITGIRAGDRPACPASTLQPASDPLTSPLTSAPTLSVRSNTYVCFQRTCLCLVRPDAPEPYQIAGAESSLYESALALP